MPSSQGGAVVSYSISPALPVGLVLDPSTGAITGTPAALMTNTGFTITATNSAGFTSTIVFITVGS
jgi:hypothetical protein